MKIIIPTYKRLHKQVTLDNIHNKENVILAVREEEAKEAEKLCDVFVLPKTVHDIATTREAIVKHFNGQQIFMPDDDVILSYFTPRKTGLMADWKPNTPDQEKQLIDTITSEMNNGFVHGGLWVANTFARSYEDIKQKPRMENSRYYTNMWYDLSQIDVDKIDWTSMKVGEDFYVALQLCLSGMPSCLRRDFGVKASASHSEGGCSNWRTAELHNKYQLKLAEMYPDYVKAEESKSKKLNGKLLYNVKIDFRKAYKNRKIQTNGLEDFF